MQEIGFGLTVKQIRIVAYRLAEQAQIKHPFSTTKQCAGWYWWASFKKRYNLSLRTPESLSMNRAQSATREALNEFYKMVEELYIKLKVQNHPQRIWNLDESGFMFVMKSGKVVALTGKTHVYKQTFGERGTTTTVLPCVNVAGDAIPPMIIFKGKRQDDRLRSAEFPCLIKLSEKGWINNDLFLEFFQHFIDNISLARPVVLFMDSHKSHLAPQVLELASKEQIYIVTYPPHITHLLQPLDVGIFSPLKAKWRNHLDMFQLEKPGVKPTRYDFLKMFSAAYQETIDKRSLIAKAFAKAGIYPINYNAIPDHAVAPSLVTCDAIENDITACTSQDRADKENHELQPESEKSQDANNQQSGCSKDFQEVLKIPKIKEKANKKSQVKKAKKKGMVYGPKQPLSANTDQNICGTCRGHFEQDVKLKNGAEWIECQFCKSWYHVLCQKVLNTTFFLCSNCELSD